jgi:hypothetical protein
MYKCTQIYAQRFSLSSIFLNNGNRLNRQGIINAYSSLVGKGSAGVPP